MQDDLADAPLPRDIHYRARVERLVRHAHARQVDRLALRSMRASAAYSRLHSGSEKCCSVSPSIAGSASPHTTLPSTARSSIACCSSHPGNARHPLYLFS